MKINTKTSPLLKAVVCFLIISTFISISVFCVNGLQQTASVEGRVVDEDDQGLSGVKIEAYLSSIENYLYSITYTDDNGYFSFKFLMIDKYNLHFSKTGYVTRIISIDTSSQWPDLGDIILYKALRLSSSVLSLVAIPGSKLTLPFTVSNNGEDLEVVKFYVFKPEGWSTRILYQNREVTEVNILAGTSLDLQLEVSIPLMSIGDNGLTLVAAGKMNSTMRFAIKVEPSDERIISCQFPGKSVLPDETARFQVSLKNPFGVEMRFMVYFDSIRLGDPH